MADPAHITDHVRRAIYGASSPADSVQDHVGTVNILCPINLI